MKTLARLLLALFAVGLSAATSDIKIPQQSPNTTPTWPDIIIAPAANSLLGFDGSKKISDVTIGTGLTLAGGVLGVTSGASGNVVGPASATDGAVVLFDGVTGKLIKGGGTLGTAAFTASTAYDVAGAAAAVTPTTLGLVIGTNTQAHAAKLDAITALASAAGWLHNDGSGAFTYSTPTYTQVGADAAGAAAAITLSGLGGVPSTRKITSTIDLSADRNLTYSDVGADAAGAAAAVTLSGLGGVPTSRTVNGHALSSNVTVTAADAGAEPALGNPGTTGFVLSSTSAGVRSWIATVSGGDFSGPSSATDGAVVLFDGTTGKLGKNGSIPGSAYTHAATDFDVAGAAAAVTVSSIGAAPAFTSGTANYFWATPNGSAGVPSLRAIVAADIPALSYDASGAAAAVTPTTLGLVIGTNTQAHAAKLDAIVALASAAGWLHNDGSGAFTYSTPTYTQVGADAAGAAAAITLSGLGGVPSTRKITSTIDLSADRNLTYSDVGADAAGAAAAVTLSGLGGVPTSRTVNGHALSSNVTVTAADAGAEPALGNPGTTGFVLSSTSAGVRSWIATVSGGDFSGPSSATDGAVVLFDGTTGKLGKNGSIPGSAYTHAATDFDVAGAAAAVTVSSIGAAPAFTSGTANYFWATPNGSAGVPSLRAIVAADIPALSYDASGAAAAVTPTTLGLVIGTNTQAHAAKLDAIVALASAAGWLHNDGSGTFAYSTPTYTQVGADAAGAAAAITLSGLGGVPTSTTVNGHALTSNVTVTASDVSLGSVTNAAQTLASVVPNTAPASGQVLVGNAGGTAYAPVSLSGPVSISSAGSTAVGVLNQSTSGSAGSLKSPATTGVMTATGMGAATTRAKTVRDADDTILELGGGSYIPTGTWVWTSASATWPTFNQSTSGTASNVSGTPALPNGTTATTQARSDTSTKLATTAFVSPAPVNLGNLTGTINIDWSAGQMFYGVLTGSTTFTFSNAYAGGWIFVQVNQTGTNSYTVTWPAMKWTAATAPTMTAGAAAHDDTVVVYLNSVYDANSVQNLK